MEAILDDSSKAVFPDVKTISHSPLEGTLNIFAMSEGSGSARVSTDRNVENQTWYPQP